MLNLDICKKCNQRHSEKRLDKFRCVSDLPFMYNKHFGIYLCYCEDFEMRWYSDRDVCTVEISIFKNDNIITGKRDNNIPRYCPYKLEHLLSVLN